LASYRVILANNGLAFYNNGPKSGTTQPHKHLQVIPLSKNVENNYKEFPLLRFID